MKCDVCKNNLKTSGCEPKCNRMCKNYSDFEPITNIDYIRRMSDEEMANWLTGVTDDAQLGSPIHVDYRWIEWLTSEVTKK